MNVEAIGWIPIRVFGDDRHMLPRTHTHTSESRISSRSCVFERTQTQKWQTRCSLNSRGNQNAEIMDVDISAQFGSRGLIESYEHLAVPSTQERKKNRCRTKSHENDTFGGKHSRVQYKVQTHSNCTHSHTWSKPRALRNNNNQMLATSEHAHPSTKMGHRTAQLNASIRGNRIVGKHHRDRINCRWLIWPKSNGRFLCRQLFGRHADWKQSHNTDSVHTLVHCRPFNVLCTCSIFDWRQPSLSINTAQYLSTPRPSSSRPITLKLNRCLVNLAYVIVVFGCLACSITAQCRRTLLIVSGGVSMTLLSGSIGSLEMSIFCSPRAEFSAVNNASNGMGSAKKNRMRATHDDNPHWNYGFGP